MFLKWDYLLLFLDAGKLNNFACCTVDTVRLNNGIQRCEKNHTFAFKGFMVRARDIFYPVAPNSGKKTPPDKSTGKNIEITFTYEKIQTSQFSLKQKASLQTTLKSPPAFHLDILIG